MSPLNLLRQAALCVGAGGMVASAMAGKIPAAKFASVAARVELRDNAAEAGPVTTAPPLRVPAPAVAPVPPTVAPVAANPIVIVASEGATAATPSTEPPAETTTVAPSRAAGSAAAGSPAAPAAKAAPVPPTAVAPSTVPPTTVPPTTVPPTTVPRPRAAEPAPAYPIAPAMEGGSTFVVGG